MDSMHVIMLTAYSLCDTSIIESNQTQVMNQKTDVISALRQWLRGEDYSSILELARSKKHTLSLLTTLTYDENKTISDRAIQATGLTAKVIAEYDPEYIRNTLLRLFWLVNDESGGICWKAPELIGEILYSCLNFEHFIPMLISLLDLEKEDAPRFRVGTLWAIGRVAQVARDAMLSALPLVQTFASTNNELETRKMASWCIEQLTPGV